MQLLEVVTEWKQASLIPGLRPLVKDTWIVSLLRRKKKKGKFEGGDFLLLLIVSNSS